MSDKKIVARDAVEALKKFTAWRNQIVGLGLLPPDLQPLIDILVNGDKELSNLETVKTGIENEIQALKGKKAGFEKKAEKHRTDFDAKCGVLDQEESELKNRLAGIKASIDESNETLRGLHEENEERLKAGRDELVSLNGKIAEAKAEMLSMKKKLG